MKFLETPLPDKKPRYMRDAFINRIHAAMSEDKSIFFLTADCGAPALDKIRHDFPERFINAGIAEQNLINLASGLALEGFKVYAYAIAPFITMRCYEQIRVNLALLSTVRKINVTLLGLGSGFSYAVSGPSHQALEDISIMRTLPYMELISPADPLSTEAAADWTLQGKGLTYIRIDGAPAHDLYDNISSLDFARGFCSTPKSSDTLLISTGFMTRKAIEIKKTHKVDVLDIFRLKSPNEKELSELVAQYPKIISWEEAFKGKGGLDSLIMNLINKHQLNVKFHAVGIEDKYLFEVGQREELHELYGAGTKQILELL